MKSTFAALLLSALVVASTTGTVAMAQNYRQVYDPQTGQYFYVPDNQLRTNQPRSNSSSQTGSIIRDAWNNPIVKRAAIGAAIGGVTGAISKESSVGKGLAVGALAGAGTGVVSRSNTLGSNPYVRTGLNGAIVGAGTSALTGGSFLRGAAIGGAVGTGAQLLQRNILNNGAPPQDTWW